MEKPEYNSPGVWHKLMALLLKPFMHERNTKFQATKAEAEKKMPTQSKARKFVGHKNQYVNGQNFASCASVCVCVALLKHKSFCQQWPAALTCDDERRQQ